MKTASELRNISMANKCVISEKLENIINEAAASGYLSVSVPADLVTDTDRYYLSELGFKIDIALVGKRSVRISWRE